MWNLLKGSKRGGGVAYSDMSDVCGCTELWCVEWSPGGSSNLRL